MFSKNNQIIKFHYIRLVEAESFRADRKMDRRTDRQTWRS